MRLIILLLFIPFFSTAQTAKFRVRENVSVVKFGDKAYFFNFIRRPNPPAPIDTSQFHVIYKMDWENSPIGFYTYAQQQNDWNPNSANNTVYEWGLVADPGPPYFKNVTIVQTGEPANQGKFMRSAYPNGYHGWSSGFSWEGDLGAMYDEVYLTYNVRFAPGFLVSGGGKLPGLGGGDMSNGVFYCSLPLDQRARYGFDGVIMWNQTNNFDSYIYHHGCTNPDGWAEGGIWDINYPFTPGQWLNITIRMVINTNGVGDGIYEGFVNGHLVFQSDHYKWREDNNLKIHKIIFHSFFGGSEPAIRDNEYADWDDICAYYIKPGQPGVPYGRQLSNSNRVLNLPVQLRN